MPGLCTKDKAVKDKFRAGEGAKQDEDRQFREGYKAG